MIAELATHFDGPPFRVATACYAEQDDDIIFEDFARLRLKGETEA